MEHILVHFKIPVFFNDGIEICITAENMENPFFYAVPTNFHTIETPKFHLAA